MPMIRRRRKRKKKKSKEEEKRVQTTEIYISLIISSGEIINDDGQLPSRFNSESSSQNPLVSFPLILDDPP